METEQQYFSSSSETIWKSMWGIERCCDSSPNLGGVPQEESFQFGQNAELLAIDQTSQTLGIPRRLLHNRVTFKGDTWFHGLSKLVRN
jgi:hypothetical protein